MRILVAGAGGQLGNAFQKIAPNHRDFNWTFVSKKELDIANYQEVSNYFDKHNFEIVLNCAAFSAVDLAEEKRKESYAANVSGVFHLIDACLRKKMILVHYSTDYVFDGKKKEGYTIEDIPNPINYYGKTKRLGECLIQAYLQNFLLIRTSWLYSDFGKNFHKTICEKGKELDLLKVVDDQIGNPTHTNDLAQFTLAQLHNRNWNRKRAHYTGQETKSWYQWACEIVKHQGLKTEVKPISSDDFSAKAKRPTFSILK